MKPLHTKGNSRPRGLRPVESKAQKGCLKIVIYTTPEVFEHKRRDGKRSEGRYCYWKLAQLPKNIFSESVKTIRLYFATRGFIRGFFKVYEIGYDSNELCFYSESWTPIKPIPQKPFQGFKYLKGASP